MKEHTVSVERALSLCLVLSAFALGAGCASSDLESEVPEAPVREGQERPGDPTSEDTDLPYDEDGGFTDEDGGFTDEDGGSTGEDGGGGCGDLACAFGETRCAGESIESCEEGPDGCPRWGSATTCPGEEVCAGGRCQIVNGCVDGDRDGYGPGCVNGPDCDDADSARNSGSQEICDGKDNDCNNMIDDGIPGVGDTCTSGQGVCEEPGQTVCDSTGQILCDAQAGTPEAEVCDGLDNDCNGTPDDGITCTAPACAQDNQEPNNSIQSAFLTGANAPVLGLTCQSDLEYYTLDAAVGVPHRINVSFPHGVSDQDLVLFENGVEVQRADSVTDHEQLVFTPRAGTVYTAQVTNPSGATTFHRLTVTPDWDCTSEDEFSPNHSAAQQAFLLKNWLAPAHMCSGGDDWYVLGQVTAGERVFVDAFFRAGFFDSGADLDMDLYANYDGDTTIERVVESVELFSDESIEYTATGTTLLYVHIYAAGGGSNDYDIGWTTQ